MKTQSIDTSPDAERVLIDRIRAAPFSRRFSFVQSWSHSMIEAGRINVQQLYPQATEQEVLLLYAERHYGKDMVDELSVLLQEREVYPTGTPDFLATLTPLFEVLNDLRVPYALCGSLASSLYGMQRATLHLDVVAALELRHSLSLREQLVSKYFFQQNEAQTALQQGTSFTLIHLMSLLKVVVSPLKARAVDKEMLGRARPLVLIEGSRPVKVLSPEDIAVLLLVQFKSSYERADDVWYDLLGLLKVQGPTIHLATLERLATLLDVVPLLERSLVDAGLKEERA
ncbi:MAG: hypothetical protein H0V70_05480 [Ktedonobacteraceae bacterium]|nr:hypothetical protein [Ktedonobacteraceae bacterium]